MTSIVDHRSARIKYFKWPQTHHIGIRIKQKQLAKILMMIQIEKKPFFFIVYIAIFQRCEGKDQFYQIAMRKPYRSAKPKPVTAHFSSKQLLPFAFALHYKQVHITR